VANSDGDARRALTRSAIVLLLSLSLSLPSSSPHPLSLSPASISGGRRWAGFARTAVAAPAPLLLRRRTTASASKSEGSCRVEGATHVREWEEES
jgi:hypothetical protein